MDTVQESREVGQTTPLEGAGDSDEPREVAVGRYTLLHQIGQGGMARVYRAWDPKLDRPVAIKVLQIGRRRIEDVQSRLRREAQAMARLNHPNVIEIYDVEVDQAALYIVMELIEGETLHEWLHRRPPWTEAVDVMMRAGEGLAAAHRAGLIHRDFKPANVMLRRADGAVLVMDFGLARALDVSDDVPWDSDVSSSEDPWLAAVTRQGEVVGTPAYMSPEQHRGHTITPATDQYSFCVSLFEALYGFRPFRSKSRREIVKLKDAAQAPHPPGTEVPRRIRAVLDRGLRPDPEERFLDMEALLHALDRARRPQLGGRTVAAGIAITAVSLGAAWMLRDPAGATPCSAQDGLRGVWDDDQRQAVEATVTEHLGPRAPTQLAKVERRLDEYAALWTQRYADACAVEEGDAKRDAAMACLAAGRSELQGVLDAVTTSADPMAVSSATAALWELSPIADCGTQRVVEADGLGGRRRAREQRLLENRLERARGLVSSAQPERALEMLERLLPEAQRSRDPRLTTRTMLAISGARAEQGRYKEAYAQLETAYATALDAGLFALAADAAIGLVGIGGKLGRWAEADQWGEHAASWVQRADAEPLRRQARLGLARSRLAGQKGDLGDSEAYAAQALEIARQEFSGPKLVPYLNAMGAAYVRQSKFEDATSHFAEALELAHETYGEGHLITAQIINNLAAVHFRQFDFEQAAILFGRAYEIEAAVVPEDEPRLATNLNNYATALAESGRYEEAEPKLRRAVAMFEKQLGPDHPRVGSAWTNLGSTLHSQGRYEEAREAHMHAIELLRNGFGPEHPTTVEALGNLAAVERARGDLAAARRLHAEVLEIRTATLDPTHTSIALALNNLGSLELQVGRRDEAKQLHERALTIYANASGPDSEGVASTRYHLGKISLLEGNAEAAREHLEDCLRIRESLTLESSYLGGPRFWLAKVLDELDVEPGQARSLARQARRDFQAMPAGTHDTEIREITAWLASRS